MATGAIHVTNTAATTGSFKSLQVGGGNFGCAEFTDIQFGKLTNPEISSSVDAVTGQIEIPAGSFIDGPIMRFKTGTNGAGKGFLAYFTK